MSIKDSRQEPFTTFVLYGTMETNFFNLPADEDEDDDDVDDKDNEEDDSAGCTIAATTCAATSALTQVFMTTTVAPR